MLTVHGHGVVVEFRKDLNTTAFELGAFGVVHCGAKEADQIEAVVVAECVPLCQVLQFAAVFR